ncbi:hypothetical protein BaRGS_00022125 [Batillaria attramentaria]|uniref:Uncharacterized protein n=1 Tax=Batillaria attramentaria TaxID=370345 RepID=A0ABD0KHD0_9CAEN
MDSLATRTQYSGDEKSQPDPKGDAVRCQAYHPRVVLRHPAAQWYWLRMGLTVLAACVLAVEQVAVIVTVVDDGNARDSTAGFEAVELAHCRT